jgi:hypothetical protein
MAFSDIERAYIDQYVGKLCKRRSPAHLADRIRTTYEIKMHDVIVAEERPRYNQPGTWTKMECAKFKYDRKNGKWKLYWMRQDRKWHHYEPETGRTDLESLVREVDADPHGAFFG